MNTKIKNKNFILALTLLVLAFILAISTMLYSGALNKSSKNVANAATTTSIGDHITIPKDVNTVASNDKLYNYKLNMNGSIASGTTAIPAFGPDNKNQVATEKSVQFSITTPFPGYKIDKIYTPYIGYISASEIVSSPGIFEIAAIKDTSDILAKKIEVNAESYETKAIIKVDISKASDVDRSLYFNIVVDSSVVRLKGVASVNVGDTASEPIIELTNHMATKISLDTILVQKNLYKTSDKTRIDNADGSAWTISDTKKLKLKYIKLTKDSTDIGSNSLNVSFDQAQNGEYAPVINFDLAIMSDQNEFDDLWADDNAANPPIFELVLEIADAQATTSRFIFKVILHPSETPFTIKSFKNALPTDLNFSGSSETFFNKKNGYVPSTGGDGFRSVAIYPKNIVDYPLRKIAFSTRNTDITNSSPNIVSATLKTDEQGDQYILVDALQNGGAFIKLVVNYQGDGTNPDKLGGKLDVYLNFNVYGKYEIANIALTSKTQKINPEDYDPFSVLVGEGYHLESAEIADTSLAIVEYKNQQLTMIPLANGDTNIEFTFSLGESKIKITTGFNVNLTRDNWFLGLALWLKIIFIGGIVIGALALILFIVWLFIRGIHKSKREEQETLTPTSSYIVKLNSTIAAAQMQNRIATQSYSNAALGVPTLQLGAGPVTTQAPDPSTLQLGIAPINTSQTFSNDGGAMTMPPINDIIMAPSMPTNADTIYIPMSDDALIERIFVEKYEPRGMTRRSFFKGKDLQARELEKEKTRIRDNVLNGMNIDEACKTDKERADEAAKKTAPVVPLTEEKAVVQNPLLIILGFDPAQPIIVTPENQGDAKKKIVIDKDGEEKFVYDETTEEEAMLSLAQTENDRLIRESVALKDRLEKSTEALNKVESDIDQKTKTKAETEEKIKALTDEITDNEVKMVSAKGKEKDRLSKESANIENQLKDLKARLTLLEEENENNDRLYTQIKEVVTKINNQVTDNSSLIVSSEKNLAACEEEARLASDRAKKAKEYQAYEKQLIFLNPLYESIAKNDKKIRELQEVVEKNNMLKVEKRSEVSSLQTQLLATTDSEIISNMSNAIKERNREIAALEKEATAASKQKSDLLSSLAASRKRANDYIDAEKIEVENIIKSEDAVLNRLDFEEKMALAEKDKADAEESLTLSYSIYDELVNNMDNDISTKAADVGNRLKEIELEQITTQMELDALNEEIENASDDDKLMMSINQMTLNEKLEEINATLEQEKANGIKSNLEFKIHCEKDIEEAAETLERVKFDYASANERITQLLANANVETVKSGSGLVSQDRQLIESSNLRKQLELSKNAYEQVKIQAKMAQMDAEKAIIDAERATAASKEEAEKNAQLAIERAEQARIEAENRAHEEAEKAKQEIDKVKAEALEQAEKARVEIESTKISAAEENQKLIREIQEDASNARRLAEQEAANARRLAEQEEERLRKEASELATQNSKDIESELEKVRKESEAEIEKLKHEAEAEIERAKKEAEEAANKANAINEASREKLAKIAEKVAKRKLEIADTRKELKLVETETQGNELKEKFYDILLRLDEDEQENIELRDLLERSMSDATHAGERARYKAAAAQGPKRIMSKVTERVNKIQRPTSAGTRPAGARPASAGTRPAGARPASAGTRPTGARPASAGTRPTGTRPASAGTRPTGARPASAGARPTSAGARPAGARPASAGTRPTGTRPTSAGARPTGARPAGAGTRPTGTRPAGAGTRPTGTRPTGTRRPPEN